MNKSVPSSTLPLRLTLAQIICRQLPPLAAFRACKLIYPQRLAYQDNVEFIARSKTGSRFIGQTNDFHAYFFAALGYYEWRNWAIARMLCQRGDTIIEIGANIGTETIAFSDIVGSNGRVFAFEPLPANVQILTRALSLSQHKNIDIIPKAVADKLGTLTFAAPSTAHKSGMGFLVMGSPTDATNMIEVESVNLSSLSSTLGRAALIHIDAEGAEYAILQGALDYFKQYSPALLLEANPHHLERAGTSVSALFTTLIALGYVTFSVERLGLTKVNAGDAHQPTNWLCLPAQKANASNQISQFIRQCALLPAIKGITPLTRGL